MAGEIESAARTDNIHDGHTGLTKRRPWIPVWSSSRSRLIQSCPRRYLLQYVAGRGGRIAMDRPRRWLWRQGRWAPTRELMLRAVKETLSAWLKDSHAGVRWTIPTARKEMERRFTRSLESQQAEMNRLRHRLQRPTALYRSPTTESIQKMSDDGDLILRRASNHPLLGELLACRFHGEWQPLDPFETTRVESGLAYLSPDLIIKGPHRWVLIRLLSRAWRAEPDEAGMIEMAGMIEWALDDATLPDDEEAYEIARISHTDKGWRTWRKPAQKGMVLGLRTLIKADLAAARRLVRDAGPLFDLDRIPLSEKAWRCRDCGYRFTCPGGSDLERARVQQQAVEKAFVLSQA